MLFGEKFSVVNLLQASRETVTDTINVDFWPATGRNFPPAVANDTLRSFSPGSLAAGLSCRTPTQCLPDCLPKHLFQFTILLAEHGPAALEDLSRALKPE